MLHITYYAAKGEREKEERKKEHTIAIAIATATIQWLSDKIEKHISFCLRYNDLYVLK